MSFENAKPTDTKERRFPAPKAGKAKAVKNFYIKRVRREAKKKLKSE
jgi:hypothetical protein